MTVGLQINALRRQRGLTLEELSAASTGTTWGCMSGGP